MPDGDLTTDDLYRARWGEPTRVAQFVRSDRSIRVLKWDADANPDGVAIYATIGAQASPVASAELHRTEFFCGLIPAQDDVASPLAALGLYAVEEGVEVGHGDTVPADVPLWPGTEMRTFLVVRSRADIFPSQGAGKPHVEMLQAIPIFESERRFKIAHDAAAILAWMEAHGVAFWDSARRPAPLGWSSGEPTFM